MKLPRDVSGSQVVRALQRLGFIVMRQRGSHVRLAKGALAVTVPAHDNMRRAHYKTSSVKRESPWKRFARHCGETRGAEKSDEREAIDLMRSLRRKREGKRMSFAKIADELNARNVPTRTGAKWHTTTVQNILSR